MRIDAATLFDFKVLSFQQHIQNRNFKTKTPTSRKINNHSLTNTLYQLISERHIANYFYSFYKNIKDRE
ncbi:hypothetical protein [Pantoea sp. CCBC3-3-1]|uniref:hypothetical protein n=1 Tax=Pantoea sp. CCBC3-3-1 TaxID=2490851 RepID=UPI0011BF613A|nr:hypothetical protein [Pantoea sp. CCBC3-3-1]